MHCASVGEYEQGRPVWQALRERHPAARFVLSFFSPSGYEHFQGREGHGEVVYLPWDVGAAPREFVERLSPKLAVFVKYEWWFGYYRALAAARVPVVLISASARPNLLLGSALPTSLSPYREALLTLDRVFAQDRATAELLRISGAGDRVEVAGDTRVDRTMAVRDLPLEEPVLAAWAARQDVLLVAGSTWGPDEEILAAALAERPGLSALVAPHEVDARAVTATEHRFRVGDARRLSDLGEGFAGRVVVVDSLGLLARLYRLGQLAYVGGGFGAGIHNVLEPAAYGVPVAFGPRHARFAEAVELAGRGVGHPVGSPGELLAFLDRHAEEESRRQVLAAAEAYFAEHAGATARILAYLTEQGYA